MGNFSERSQQPIVSESVNAEKTRPGDGDMGSRLRALIGVIFLLSVIAGLPMAGPAGAQAREVAVSVRSLAPFVMTKDNQRTGFTIELWEEIAKRQGWTTKYVDAENVAAQLKDITERRADVAAGAISITADRMANFDFSQPILGGGLQILVPKHSSASAEPGIKKFLPLLFSKTMLIWLLGGLVLALIPAHLNWLAERRHPDSMVAESYIPGIFEAFIFAGEALTQTQKEVPRQWLSRVMTILWGFVAIVFVSFFTATLTTTLTVDSFASRINGPSDLAGKKVATVAGTTSAKYLKGRGVVATELHTINDCYEALEKGGYEAVVFDSPVLHYYVAQDGADVGELAGSIFQAESYGLAFAKGSDLRLAVDKSLLALRQDGTYEKIRDKYFGSQAGD